MDNFTRTVTVGKLITSPSDSEFVRVEITYRDGELSIQGQTRYSGGQIRDVLIDDRIIPIGDWTTDMLNELFGIWKEWHLNYMHPYCQHQKELGWREIAMEKVNLYNWSMSMDTYRELRDTKDRIYNTIAQGKTFTPTEEETFLLNLPFSKQTWKDSLPNDVADYYVPYNEKIPPITKKHIEIHRLGSITQEQHPNGLLSKPCPVCGYKYGTAWQKEEVPEDILQWLKEIPG